MDFDLVAAAPWVAYLGAAVALATPVSKLIRSLSGIKKDSADATKTLIDGSVSVVKTLRQECDELEQDLAHSREKAKDLEKQVDVLTASLRNAQAEISGLRGQVDRMSKDLSAAHDELAAFRNPQ